MKTLALPLLCIALLGAAGCSVFVEADRDKIKDDLYTPTDAGAPADAGTGTDASDASDEDGGAADAGDAAVDAGDEADGG